MIYSSDNELFYITYTLETSATATNPSGSSGFYYERVYIPHGLPYTPLPFVVYSLDPDFKTFDVATDVYSALTPTEEFGSAYVFSTPQDIFLYFEAPAAKRTMYFRVFGFRNPTYEGAIEPKQISQKWRFNTDLKYPQLVALGKFTSGTYNHNLGYKPLAFEWVEGDDGYISLTDIAKVTNTTITLSPDSGSYSNFYLALFNQPGI